MDEILNIEMLEDEQFFDAFYPDHLREIAEIHFTPIEVVKQAAKYLVDNRVTRVLDIGSGAGKFCIVGSICTNGIFTGVEVRKSFHEIAENCWLQHKLQNVQFLNANIIDVSFESFDAFYLFNPFYENMDASGVINNEIQLGRDLYDRYSRYVLEQLDLKPIHTRLVSYFSYLDEIPKSYELVRTEFDGKLKMWEKRK